MKGARLLKHTGWIAWKDLLDLTRNRIGLVMIIIMPMFMMIMTGYIFPSNTGISHQPIGIVNNDIGMMSLNGTVNRMPSAMFVAALYSMGDKTGMMDLSNATTIDGLKDQITNGKLSGGIIIEVNFTANFLSGKQGNITVMADESNPQMYAMIQAALSQVINQMGTMVAQSQLNNTVITSVNRTINDNNSLAVIKPYNVTISGVTASGSSNYFEFVAPGIMMMTVMMSLMTGLPHAISHEKEAGTLDGMLTAPVNRLAIILGKSLSQTITGLIQGTIILILAVALFGVVIYGNILLVFFLLLLGVFSFVGLGIVITCYAKEEQTASMIMMALMFPMMFLSGVFFPTQQMPWFMQYIAHALPLTYAANAMRKVIVLGAGVSAITLELAILIGFGAVMLIIAIPMFKKAMTR